MATNLPSASQEIAYAFGVIELIVMAAKLAAQNSVFRHTEWCAIKCDMSLPLSLSRIKKESSWTPLYPRINSFVYVCFMNIRLCYIHQYFLFFCLNLAIDVISSI